MRNTLVIGLLLCLPVALLLALASLAMVAGKICRSTLVSQVLAMLAQAGARGQRDELFGLRPVVVDWRHGEDEPALAQAHRLDQDGAAGSGQDDDITGIDVASKDHILHK